MKIIKYYLPFIFLVIVFNSAVANDLWHKTKFHETVAYQPITIAVDGKIIYASTKEKGVFASSDMGENWNLIFQNQDDYVINDIQFSQANRIYLMSSQYIYYTDDSGKNWKRINYFMQNKLTIDCFSVYGNCIYVGTSGGVFYSESNFETWLRITIGIQNFKVSAIAALDKNAGVFSVSGTGAGIYYVPSNKEKVRLINDGIVPFAPARKMISPNGIDIFASVEKRLYKFNSEQNLWEKFYTDSNEEITTFSMEKSGFILLAAGSKLILYDNIAKEWMTNCRDMTFKTNIIDCRVSIDGVGLIIDEYIIRINPDIFGTLERAFYDYEITLKDIRNNIIRNKPVKIYKNDVLLKSVNSDINGKVEFQANRKDSIKISATIYKKTNVKSGHSILDGNTMYSVTLDNGFDNQFGWYGYDPLRNDYVCTRILSHTVIKLNLLISIEWDASAEYIDSLKSWVMLLSDYLFDVTDGHLMLGEVAIYDNLFNWDDADIKIHLSNSVHPHARVDGIRTGSDDGHIYMPRKWHGTDDNTRNRSSRTDWLILDTQGNLRTIGHELGHYFFRFFDEYLYIIENVTHLTGYNYGFMDSQYPGGEPFASEMSSMYSYASPIHQITEQWGYRGKDCWSDFESQFEDTYDGFYARIIKPSERISLGGNNYLVGPNQNVGKHITFHIYDISRGPSAEYLATYEDEYNGLLVDRATVKLKKRIHPDLSIWDETALGLTTDTGSMRVLGAQNGDRLVASKYIGHRFYYDEREINPIPFTNKDNDKIQAESIIKIKPVSGYFEMLNELVYESDNSLQFRCYVNNILSYNPLVAMLNAQGELSQYNTDYSSADRRYYTKLDKIHRKDGYLIVTMKDYDSKDFRAYFDYTIKPFSELMNGPDGSLTIYFNKENTSIQQVCFFESQFSPLMNGLPKESEFIGKIHSIYGFPKITEANKKNRFAFKYDKNELKFLSEKQIRIFRWSEDKFKWEKVGGVVDTMMRLVKGSFNKDGIYALFAVSEEVGMNYFDDSKLKMHISPIPAQNSLSIVYEIENPSIVTIEIINILGEIVLFPVHNQAKEAFTYQLNLDLNSLSSGNYFVKLTAGRNTCVKTFIVIK